MALFTKKKDEERPSFQVLPNHLGIIMDGNGRWAKKEVCRVKPAISKALMCSVPFHRNVPTWASVT